MENPITTEENGWTIASALTSAAGAKLVIHCGHFTLGTHPDAAKREAGELALIDWSRPGGEVVAEDEAGRALLGQVGQARALGAVGRALIKTWAKLQPWIGRWRDLAREAEQVVELPGGPADPDLRLGLAMRAVALQHMGVRGDIPARHSPRPTDVQGIEADAFDIAAVVAHVRLTDADRAALAPVAPAAPRPALRVNPRALELRPPASVDAAKPVRLKPLWTVQSADRDGKPTERVWKLPRLHAWHGHAIWDFCTSRPRYRLFVRLGGRDSDSYQQTGIAFNRIADLLDWLAENPPRVGAA